MLARIRPKHVAWAAIAAGALWRAADLGYGLPAAYVPDEEMVVGSVLGMAGDHTLRPPLLDYPGLYQYVVLAVYGAAFAAMKLFGAVSSASEFGVRFYEDPSLFYFLARLVSASFGVGAILLVWRIGARLFGGWAGAAAALVLALSPVHQTQSLAATPNSAMTFAGALALFAIVRLLDAERAGRARDYLLAGAAIALSVSFKYNTGLLVLSLGAAHLLRRPRAPHRRLLLALAVVPVLFLALNPYWVLDFPAYRDAFLFQSSHMKMGHPGHLHGPPVLWFAMRGLVEEGIVGAALVAGLLVSIARGAFVRFPAPARSRGDLVLLAYALPSFLAITSLPNQGLDYCVGLYPALAILAGRAIASGLARIGGAPGRHAAHGARTGERRPLATFAVALLLLATALVLAGARLRDTHLPDTRTLARAWVEENLPDGASIGIDGLVYNPQLLRRDRFEGNAPGSAFLDPAILDRARERLAGRPTYRIVPMGDVYEEPRWPDATPPDVRARYSSEPWVRQMFRRRPLGIDELLSRGAQYFFLSSYSLRGALYSRWYPPDSPVHYLTLRDKLWHDGLLADSRVSLVRKWEPDERTRGPILALYELARAPDAGP
ncbi:MAG: phospholipid carrier-dependent glycosyltransferase [Candidatus Latescibacterota bacterium]|nr:MAG: phospholipid carrier-dependent glycosyltransferase [Candidatus Latescibacterota bacterium]